MAAVFVEFRQLLVVFNFMLSFSTTNTLQRGIDRQSIKPGGQCRVAFERVGFAIDGPKDVLDYFLGVRRFAENSLRHIVKFAGVETKDRFQCRLIAVFESLDSLAVGSRQFLPTR